jgi:UDP-N-acetylmuramate dehydrogenase
MKILENFSLTPYNTFGIQAKARYFFEVKNIEELRTLITTSPYKDMPKLLLGGGSNLLFTQDFEGLVIKMSIKGVEVIREDDEHVWLKAGAGEVWHEFVLHTIKAGYCGLENLSLIPGSVGAAPMQNIGAYGAEIKDFFDQLEAMEIANGNVKSFTHSECDFGYRHSVFKTSLKDQYIITSVTFKLSKNESFNISYGAIQQTLEEMGVQELSIKAISDAVIQIRQSKLPDPKMIGNAGSFFKNPYVSRHLYEKLKTQFPEMPAYELPDDRVKVPAGWLIEQCGWKGKVVGNTGVHSKQALVLVNHGNAKGLEVKELALNIQASVKEKFGIELSPEVNII